MAEEGILQQLGTAISGLFSSNEEGGGDESKAEALKAMAAAPEQEERAAQLKTMAGEPTRAEQLKSMAETNSIMDWIYGINIAIADGLDTTGNALEQLAGTPEGQRGQFGSAREAFDSMGFTPKAEMESNSNAMAGGKFTGEMLPFLLAGPLGMKMKAAAQGLGPIPTVGREIVQSIGKMFVKEPVFATTTELLAGTTAGIGGKLVSEKFPDSPAAEAIGNILGGLSPAVAVKTGELALKATVGISKNLPLAGVAFRKGFEFTENTAKSVRASIALKKDFGVGETRRSVARVGRAVKDQNQALKDIKDPDVLPEAKGILTPAQRTNEPQLMALEKSVIESSDDLGLEFSNKLAQLNALIYRSMRDLGGNPEATRETYELKQQYITELLDGRLRAAAERADKSIGALQESASPQAANLIAGEELAKAMAVGRLQETDFWNAVPDNVPSGLVTARAVLQKELLSRSPAEDKKDIPEFVHDWLGKLNSKRVLTQGKEVKKIKRAPSVKDVRALRSRILAYARGEGGAVPTSNSLRIMNDLEEALLSDLGASRGAVEGEVGEALRRAFDYSHTFNDRFKRGPVRNLLAKAKGGGPKVAPELTLQNTLGMRGPKAGVNAKALIAAVQNNPDPKFKVEQDVLRGAMEDWIKAKFNEVAVRGGRVRTTKVNNKPVGQAVDFLRNYKTLLDEFPEVRADIEEAILTENARLLADRHVRSVGSRLANPNISKATMFIKRDPHKVFRELADTRLKNLKREVLNLINMTTQDFTGEARDGLNGAFVDWVLQNSLVRNVEDFTHEPFVSGAKMRHFIENPNINWMAKRLLGEEKFKRLEMVLHTASKIDNVLNAHPAKEGVIGDTPNALIDFIVRISSAQGARVFAGKFGGGTVQTPGIAVGMTRKFLQDRVHDPASKVIIEAVTSDDPELMEALIRGILSPADEKFVRQRIHAWIAATLHKLGGEFIEIPEDQQAIGP